MKKLWPWIVFALGIAGLIFLWRYGDHTPPTPFSSGTEHGSFHCAANLPCDGERK